MNTTLTPEQIVDIKKWIEFYNADLLDNPSLDFVIEDSGNSLSEEYFGKFYCKAVALLVLHTFSIKKQAEIGGGEGGGLLASKTIGPVKVTYASFSGSRSYSVLSTTIYGNMLKDLMNTCGGGAITVTGAWRDM